MDDGAEEEFGPLDTILGLSEMTVDGIDFTGLKEYAKS